MKNSKLQSLSTKIGEVKFRQKLVKQHRGEKWSIPGEPDQKEIYQILRQRVETTRKIFQKLISQGWVLSPFLEIGAEKGQRATLLVNEFRASGFAIDISLESLAAAPQFAKTLGFAKLPALVCADAYNLPFADSSFPFIFCFETLHHFPDPTPIIKEVYRVLAPGGVFYFNEEPVKQIFNLNLWRRGYHLSPWEKTLKFMGILPFLSRIGKAEVSHGILEEEFPLKTWREALSVFEKVKTVVKPVFFGPSSILVKNQNGWQNPRPFTFGLMALQGGGIEGFGVKKGRGKLPTILGKTLICPDCHHSLINRGQAYLCSQCQRVFRQETGVLMLLPIKLQEKLYD